MKNRTYKLQGVESMNLVCESDNLDEYLLELNEVNYSNPIIKEKSS
jgi:hypothetical protein